MSQIQKALYFAAALAATGAVAQDDSRTPTPVFKNTTEAGVLIAAGNSSARSYNIKQIDTYDFYNNTLAFNAQYLRGEASGVETALWWNLGLRYQRHFPPTNVGAYVGASTEANRFAGFDHRHHADAGVTFTALKTDDFWWIFEAGYRYTVEDPVGAGANTKSHYGRAFLEVFKDWTPTVSLNYWVEYLPNFSNKEHWQLNTEANVNFFLNDNFSVKLGYLYKYNHLIVAPVTSHWDSFFTTALVAKF